MAVRLVNPRKLLAPQRCFICELTPRDDLRVVDTGRKSQSLPLKHRMKGRKYICSLCGDLIAKALGYASLRESADLKEQVAALTARVTELNEMVELQDAVQRLASIVQIKGAADGSTRKRTGGVSATAEVPEK